MRERHDEAQALVLSHSFVIVGLSISCNTWQKPTLLPVSIEKVGEKAGRGHQ